MRQLSKPAAAKLGVVSGEIQAEVRALGYSIRKSSNCGHSPTAFTKFTVLSSFRFQQHPRLNGNIPSTGVFHSKQEKNIPMSSTLNVLQMEANRRNAQLSTGPRTEAGLKISSLNAVRHGLTSRVVVLPSEDLSAYKKFSDEFLAGLAPETFPETQCAQTIIDTQWRLNRVRSLEEGMLAHGHGSPAGQVDYGHPEIHGALTQAAVFLEHSQAFVNLSMHEQRLYRILTAATKALDEMQSKRKPPARPRSTKPSPSVT